MEWSAPLQRWLDKSVRSDPQTCNLLLITGVIGLLIILMIMFDVKKKGFDLNKDEIILHVGDMS